MNEERIIEQLNIELNKRDSSVLSKIDWERDYLPYEESIAQKKSWSWFKPMTLVFAMIVLLAVLVNQLMVPPKSQDRLLYMDVNPTFVMSVDDDNEVTSVSSNSVEGEVIVRALGDVDDESLESVVQRLLKLLKSHSYLSHEHNFMVISSQSSQDQDLVDKVVGSFESHNITPLHQEIDDEDDNLKTLAQQYNLSVSKMRFVLRVHDFYDEKSIFELANLSIRELIEYLSESDKKLSDFDKNLINIQITQQVPEPEPEPTPTPTPTPTPEPTPEPQGLISREEALAIAYQYFGVSSSNVRDLDVELDDGKWEIDFEIGNTEYEIDIRARDGKVLDADKDVDDDYDNDDNNDND